MIRFGGPGAASTIGSERAATRRWWNGLVPVLLVLGVLLLVFGRPETVNAHAFIAESNPPANSVMPSPPNPGTLKFTEPLEQSYSRVELYDQHGNLVPGASFTFGADGFTMEVKFPANLPNGTYSLLWRTLSAADGHTAEGYIPFTVGAERDVTTIVPPADTTVSEGAPELAKSISRWLALLALAATVAVWPIWLFVIRPAISPAWQAGPGLTRRARRFAVFAVLGSAVANLIALGVQSIAVLGSAGVLDAIVTTVRQTRWGTFWLIRMGLLLMFAAALLGAAWWWPRRQRIVTVVALVLAAVLPIPFSMLSHAAAQPEGQFTAIAFDYVHLLAASLWVGGVLVLLFVLGPTLRALTPAGRQVVLGRALPRFSMIALIAWAVLVLTGFYSGLLQVGNLTALTTTPYGQTLIIKLALLLPLLALGAFNLFVVTRKIKRAETEATASGWSRHLVTALAAEAVLVTVLLAVVGSLIGQPPAREVLAQNAGRLVIPLNADGQQGTLYLTPGAVGANHYRVELGSGHEAHLRNSAGTTVTLRFEQTSLQSGQQELKLLPAAAGAFEGHGSELSLAGDWNIEVLVKAEGQPDWDVTVTTPIGVDPPTVDLPPPPPWLGPIGVLGLLFGVAGIAGLVWAVFGRDSVMRKEIAALGAVAVVLAGLFILQSRLPVTSTALASVSGGVVAGLTPPDPAAVTRGAPLFAANCASCHGAGGKGDGPLASATLQPANLTLSHARLHDQATLELWISNGITGTKMPGFGKELTPNQIDDVIAYVRQLQYDAAKVADTPGEAICDTIQPRTIDQIKALTVGAGTPVAAGALPVFASPPAGGTAVDQATADQIHQSVRDLVACSNAGDTMRRLALYSDAQMKRAYPTGPTSTLTRIAGTPVPVIPEERVSLVDVQNPMKLADGRVMVKAIIDNPAYHTHGPQSATGNGSSESAILIYVFENGGWKIDQVLQGT